jgi:FAD-linked sulfhydryl oxidase
VGVSRGLAVRRSSVVLGLLSVDPSVTPTKTMSYGRPGSRPTDKEILSDDCNTCDMLGATAKGMLAGSVPSRTPMPPPGRTSSSDHSQAALYSASMDKESTEEAWAPKPAPGIVEIGNAGWTTIHTFAAYFPERPSERQRQSAKNLIDSFTELFPCRWCADDLKEHVEKHPVKTESRTAFSQWTCEAHNHVNEHLGKPLFDCAQFDRIWRRHQAGLSNQDSSSL